MYDHLTSKGGGTFEAVSWILPAKPASSGKVKILHFGRKGHNIPRFPTMIRTNSCK
jgi:hypothetical protein